MKKICGGSGCFFDPFGAVKINNPNAEWTGLGRRKPVAGENKKARRPNVPERRAG